MSEDSVVEGVSSPGNVTGDEIDVLKQELQNLSDAYEASRNELIVAKSDYDQLNRHVTKVQVLSNLKVQAAEMGAIDPHDIEKFIYFSDEMNVESVHEIQFLEQLEALRTSKPYLFGAHRTVEKPDVLSGVSPRPEDVLTETDVRYVKSEDYIEKKRRFLAS